MLTGGFTSIIKYIKERLVNIVVILKAWLFIKYL
jgi:hypothetical protein